MHHDKFRLKILKQACSIKSFRDSWPYYKSILDGLLGANPDGQSVFDLGSHLSSIFRGHGVKRSSGQGALSTSGAAWEVLAVWYLNFVFWNTSVLATRSNAQFVPQKIRDSISVSISNQKTNTESDVLVYSVPQELTIEPTLSEIDELVAKRISEVELAVIQLKTNWNDNAQIPMLWDIVYNSYNKLGSPIPHVQVGNNGVTPSSFQKFSYSFLTVPTTKLPNPNSVSVSRVRNISGGNFWGMAARDGVAMPFSEFFHRNFHKHFEYYGSVQNHISSNINNDNSFIDRFLNLNF